MRKDKNEIKLLNIRMILTGIIGLVFLSNVIPFGISTPTLSYTLTAFIPQSNKMFGLAIEYLSNSGGSPGAPAEVVILEKARYFLYNISDPNNPIINGTNPWAGYPPPFNSDDLTVGDFNYDGFDDLVISDSLRPSPPFGITSGGIRVFVGPIINGSWDSDFIIYGPMINDALFGFSMDAGDFDGDGYDDLIISAPGISGMSGNGEVYIYWGSDDFDDHSSQYGWENMLYTPMTIQPDINSGFDDIGWCVRNVGDLDDDRDDEEEIQYYDDFVITNKNQEVYCTSYDIAVFYGNSRNSINSTPDVQIITGNRYFGADVDSGDINGDGYSDIVTGYLVDVRGNRVNVGTVVIIYPGSSNGVSSNNGYSKLAESTPFSDDPPYDVACMGDEDNDGYDDILMSRPYYNDSGIVYCWNGVSNLSNLDYSSWNLTGYQSGQLFGYYRECAGKAICGIPDTDDDMCDEVFIGSPYWDGNSTTDSGMVEYYK